MLCSRAEEGADYLGMEVEYDDVTRFFFPLQGSLVHNVELVQMTFFMQHHLYSPPPGHQFRQQGGKFTLTVLFSVTVWKHKWDGHAQCPCGMVGRNPKKANAARLLFGPVEISILRIRIDDILQKNNSEVAKENQGFNK